ncbi:MAG: PilZ domain-containing protein [Candidatus Omnitrophica bacterium]|nr:PilZ domain-containing protein [Candidatus Omnitrophota bacterium]
MSNDLSRGGLCMPASSGVLSKGDTVNLDMENKDTREYISATGKVKWLKTLDRNAPLDEEVGIEFTSIQPTDIDKLLKNNT